MSNVYLVKGESRKENVKQAVKLAEAEYLEKLKKSKSILIKVNFVSSDKQLAATHVDAVKGTIEALREHTDAPISVGDAAYKDTDDAFRNFGYNELEENYENVTLIDLNRSEATDFELYTAEKAKRKIKISKTALNFDFKVSLAIMKTHCDVITTLSIKNWSVGIMLPGLNENQMHTRCHYIHEDDFATVNKNTLKVTKEHPFDLGIIDGFEAMEGDGPAMGTPKEMKVALAGVDFVELDAVATEIMGFKASDIGYLFIANKEGMGEIELDKINVEGNVSVEDVKTKFENPKKYEEQLKWKEQLTKDL